MQIIDFLLNFFLCRLFTINFCIFRWFLLLWFLARPFFPSYCLYFCYDTYLTSHLSMALDLALIWRFASCKFRIRNYKSWRKKRCHEYELSNFHFFPSFLVWICLRFYNPYWNKHTPFGSLAAILFWTFLIAMYINVDLRSLSMRLMLSTTIFSML